MKHLPQLLFLLLASTAVAFSVSQCGQGRIDDAFGDTDAGLRNTLIKQKIYNDRLIQEFQENIALFRDPRNVRSYQHARQLTQEADRFYQFMDSLHAAVAATTTTADTRSRPVDRQWLEDVLPALAARTERMRQTVFATKDSCPLPMDSLPVAFEVWSNGVYRLAGSGGRLGALPLSGVLAVLSGLETAAASAVSCVLIYCRIIYQVRPEHAMALDRYNPVVASRTAWIETGSRYQANFSLGIYMSENEIISLKINSEDCRPGHWHYQAICRDTGWHHYTVDYRVRREHPDGHFDTVQTAGTFAYFVDAPPPKIRVRQPVLRRPSLPAAFLPGLLEGNLINQQQLAAIDKLQTRWPDSANEPEWPVTGFTVTRFRPREDPEEVRNRGAAFGPAVRRLLQTARPGDRLLFDDVSARAPGARRVSSVGVLAVRVE